MAARIVSHPRPVPATYVPGAQARPMVQAASVGPQIPFRPALVQLMREAGETDISDVTVAALSELTSAFMMDLVSARVGRG